MTDLHIHILPGVDDGSASMEESLRMARMAVDSGVTDMAVTPHCNLPWNPQVLWAPELQERTGQLQRELDRQHIPLTLHTGMEIYGTPDVPGMFRDGRLCTLGGSRYPLIEFAFTDCAQEAARILRRLLELGYRPLVAHPERYRYLQQHPGLVNQWAGMGCLFQINRGSLYGRFGRGAEQLAWALLDRGFAACIATDAHGAARRTPWMRDVRQLIAEEYSPRLAQRLLEDNPRRILRDQEIELEEPDWF